MGEGELLELVGVLAAALAIAHDELHALTEEPLRDVPLDESVIKHLRQRDAFVETFGRLNDSAKVTKAQLRKVFEEELGKADRIEVTELHVPQLPEVRDALTEVCELLRRRALVEPSLRDAVRPVVTGWAW